MKYPIFMAAVALVAFGGLSAQEPVGTTNYKSESVSTMESSTETFMSKVLRVYAFEDDQAHYVAYVVEWRGREVIVTGSNPDPAKSLKIGDPIRCTMRRMVSTMGSSKRGTLSFSVSGNQGAPESATSIGSESARADAWAEEMRRRRELREQAMDAAHKK